MRYRRERSGVRHHGPVLGRQRQATVQGLGGQDQRDTAGTVVDEEDGRGSGEGVQIPTQGVGRIRLSGTVVPLWSCWIFLDHDLNLV